MVWTSDLLTRARAALPGAANRIAWYERQRGWGDRLSVLMNLDDDGRLYSHDGPSGLDDKDITVDVFGATGEPVEVAAQALRAMFETRDVTIGGTIFGMGFVRTGRTLGPEDMPDGARVFRRRMLVRFSVEAA